ncbi:acyl-CoA Delta-9 desaturase-like isoform X2 [Ischnura elegans]|uniref:acyl-CoA Delta-9 desaturase-like isoform X2 n=1 Tax=Ischnura elegans TaxID=197161 RepID=UPI001ED893D5|nr:acyl-CoA Delta-9 desaturase-like isoform X2 [Ischnura elegans]
MSTPLRSVHFFHFYSVVDRSPSEMGEMSCKENSCKEKPSQVEDCSKENWSNESSDQVTIKREISWPNVLLFLYLHLSALYGFFLIFTEAQFKTTLFALSLVMVASLGLMAGAHRLWAHHSYVASLPLRIILICCHTLSGQGTVYEWVRNHRLHHLYFGTKLDPFGVQKGLLFSHFTCHLIKLHPSTEELHSQIDMTDLEADSLVMFQKRFKWILIPVFCFFLPLNAPMEYWNESIFVSFFVVGFLRFALNVNINWLMHSGYNIWGLKAGSRYPSGDDNSVFLVTKTHWPAYHYLMPYDYRCCEMGGYGTGLVTAFIDSHILMGTARDAKTTNTKITMDALKLAAKSGAPLHKCLSDIMSKKS